MIFLGYKLLLVNNEKPKNEDYPVVDFSQMNDTEESKKDIQLIGTIENRKNICSNSTLKNRINDGKVQLDFDVSKKQVINVMDKYGFCDFKPEFVKSPELVEYTIDNKLIRVLDDKYSLVFETTKEENVEKKVVYVGDLEGNYIFGDNKTNYLLTYYENDLPIKVERYEDNNLLYILDYKYENDNRYVITKTNKKNRESYIRTGLKEIYNVENNKLMSIQRYSTKRNEMLSEETFEYNNNLVISSEGFIYNNGFLVFVPNRMAMSDYQIYSYDNNGLFVSSYHGDGQSYHYYYDYENKKMISFKYWDYNTENVSYKEKAIDSYLMNNMVDPPFVRLNQVQFSTDSAFRNIGIY